MEKNEFINVLNKNGFSATEEQGIVMVHSYNSIKEKSLDSEIKKLAIKYDYHGSYGYRISSNTKNDSIADEKNNAAIDSDPIKYKKFDYISEEENSQMRLIL